MQISPSTEHHGHQFTPCAYAPPPSLQFKSMRKLLHHLHSLASPLASPSPSPNPLTIYRDFTSRDSFFFSLVPVTKSIFDITTLSFIAVLLLISLLAFSFIFHLRWRSRRLHHLQNFNSLWTVRLLLVSFASLWALNEILRLSSVRRKYLYPFLPSISLNQQASICKLHVVLSLGLLEPGFLITLLFLVNFSIKKSNRLRSWAPVSVLIICSPIILLQVILVYFSSFHVELPKFMHGSSILATDELGNRTVLCLYPFFSCIIFGGFTVAYGMAFLVSCWRITTFVINKTIRYRINMLATSVMVALPVQILCLTMSWLWMPEDKAYGCVVLVIFLCVAFFMVVGEFILVLRPTMDALAAGAEYCQTGPGVVLRQPACTEGREQGPSL